MSVGGKLIEWVELPDDARDSLATHRAWVMDDDGTECCVELHNDQGVREPQLGEVLWWQSGRAFFGGPDPKRGEISWRKCGNSYDPHRVIKRYPA